jgi:hypothetical protein
MKPFKKEKEFEFKGPYEVKAPSIKNEKIRIIRIK